MDFNIARPTVSTVRHPGPSKVKRLGSYWSPTGRQPCRRVAVFHWRGSARALPKRVPRDPRGALVSMYCLCTSCSQRWCWSTPAWSTGSSPTPSGLMRMAIEHAGPLGHRPRNAGSACRHGPIRGGSRCSGSGAAWCVRCFVSDIPGSPTAPQKTLKVRHVGSDGRAVRKEDRRHLRDQWEAGFGGDLAGLEAAGRMTAALQSRGPDGSDCWSDG